MDQELDIEASIRYLPMSPQKVGLVLDLVRGRQAGEALEILQFTSKAASRPVAKLIRSAMANAEENFGLDPADLFIHRISVGQGPIRRWRRFGARGRFKPIRRRYSHVKVILREREAWAE